MLGEERINAVTEEPVPVHIGSRNGADYLPVSIVYSAGLTPLRRDYEVPLSPRETQPSAIAEDDIRAMIMADQKLASLYRGPSSKPVEVVGDISAHLARMEGWYQTRLEGQDPADDAIISTDQEVYRLFFQGNRPTDHAQWRGYKAGDKAEINYHPNGNPNDFMKFTVTLRGPITDQASSSDRQLYLASVTNGLAWSMST